MMERRATNPFSSGFDWIDSKGFSTTGKILIVWLIYKYSEQVINHENVLFVLLLFLIMPDLVRKILSLMFESKLPIRGYSTRSEHIRDTTTVTPNDHPPPKEQQ